MTIAEFTRALRVAHTSAHEWPIADYQRRRVQHDIEVMLFEISSWGDPPPVRADDRGFEHRDAS